MSTTYKSNRAYSWPLSDFSAFPFRTPIIVWDTQIYQFVGKSGQLSLSSLMGVCFEISSRTILVATKSATADVGVGVGALIFSFEI
jgi:hypothetical protein